LAWSQNSWGHRSLKLIIRGIVKLLTFFFFLSVAVQAQIPVGIQALLDRLVPGTVLPEHLLRTRSVVFYPHTMDMKELEKAQEYFHRSGIDAVLYLDSDLLAAGRDPSVALAQYLNVREIANLLIFQKKERQYSLHVVAYNRMADLFPQGQVSWYGEHDRLEPLLHRLYLAVNNGGLKRENMLINEYPELAMPLNLFRGNRSEFFAIDLKVDPLGVPLFGDAAMDSVLADLMKDYPYKFKFTDAGLPEGQIRRDGSYYVLRFVYARAKLAYRMMGYASSPGENAIVSVTWHDDQPELQSIAEDAYVYKFYFKHIDSGNIFLGTKWDADVSWQQALINQLKAFKAELRIR